MANTWHTVTRRGSASNSSRPVRHTSSLSRRSLRVKEVDWEVVGTWFPDSTRFVTNAHPKGALRGVFEGGWSSPDSSIWVVSVLGGPPHKLRDNAVAYSVSPDGSWIGFGTNKGRLGDREIWLMRPSGEQAQKLFDTDDSSSIGGLSWSSDGKRVLYVKTDQSGGSLLSRDLQGGPPTTIFGPDEMKQVGRSCLAGGWTSPLFGLGILFWQLQLLADDPRCAKRHTNRKTKTTHELDWLLHEWHERHGRRQETCFPEMGGQRNFVPG